MTIESYDRDTGIITFTEELQYYHYGQSGSTARDYSGVDMRGEVLLLSRNVRVVGEDNDAWGAQIVVADTFELSGVTRTGTVIFDNIECENCSQRDTMKSGIRFENAKEGHSSVTNSAVHGGLGWIFSV